MPYDKTSSLPQAVQKLPAKAQEVFLGAYNAAWEDHSGEKGREQTCAAIAWAAVKKVYEKKGETWVAREAMKPADWKKAYKQGTPHWAEDTKPTEFATEFVQAMKDAKAKSVLEVGCGNGRDSVLFAEQGFEAHAIDIAPEAVAMAQVAAEKAGVALDAKIANAASLPFEDGQFDAFYSLSVLHSTDLKQTIPEAFRVLAKGGVAFVYIYGSTVKGAKVADAISLDSYIGLLRDAGFALVDFYSEQEDELDEYGESHRLFVALLEKP